ncbi:MAG: pyridoxamine 5'-phosphate oxidase [Actinomycetota bacterium]|nr:pyridoxamine 5'-phosphate oxidase [Actinomycetota bacterium]
MAATFADVRHYAGSEQGLCVAAVTRADGSVHTSVVNAGPMAHPLTGVDVVALVVRSDAVKLGRFRETGRGSLTFRRGWRWVSVDGPCDIFAPGTTDVDLPALLRAIFAAAGGTHDDWDEFDRMMAKEQRAGVLIHPDRIIGQP